MTPPDCVCPDIETLALECDLFPQHVRDRLSLVQRALYLLDYLAYEEEEENRILWGTKG